MQMRSIEIKVSNRFTIFENLEGTAFEINNSVFVNVKFSAAETLGYHRILENTLWFVEESFSLAEQKRAVWKVTRDNACNCDEQQ